MIENYCECKYTERCSTSRQYVQFLHRDKNPQLTVEQCQYYRYIEEKEG